MTAYYRVDEPGTVDELFRGYTCANAAYVFDTPLKLDPNDLIELTDGAVFLITKNVRIHISGKWDR